ncbi:tRNA pseudouridine synthase D [Heterostelium album PN500]|uniref:tRNA pseudouridine synthase D n=1 Tax=Heterostelium pallidum (strain ATCC 26659 / Pp 5 / PN500) TaxID=670386 RepID=D3BIM4_HETP5|nr:tRNA pseudouridine synthase D [Heterostelium album PN500]EFA78648.1 tRNA pseudouridine synthase D [Heterostelium album PN500]|eukprot:XP_020430772.1 tRNA pseudouridine synthase D [Heterostelium album PN500]
MSSSDENIKMEDVGEQQQITTTTTSTDSTTTSIPTPPQRNPINNRTEKSVGIECFLGTSAPWTGILKQRYDDFIVNEIDINGNVITLNSITDTEPTEEKEPEKPKVQEETKPETEVVEQPTISEKVVKDLEDIVGNEQATKFLEFVNVTSKSNPKSKFLFDLIQDKEKRTSLHLLIKHSFRMISETENSCVKVLSSSRGSRGDNRDAWPAGRPKYLQFVLFKENKESMDAFNIISKQLKVNQRIFSMAGTKDKRGVTTQSVTAFKMNHKRLLGVNSRLYGMKVGGDFKYVDKHLQLGDLSGNRFTIVIRDISADDQLVESSVEQFKKTGFINYYGLQRFGTGSVSTHQIGKSIIRGEWEEVIKLMLYPREGEKEELRVARQKYKDSGDVKALMRSLPKMTSERIKLYGHELPVVGDLVAVDIDKKAKDDNEANNNNNEGESNVLEDAQDEEVPDDDDSDFHIVHVTEEDVKAGRYNISQVVLPMFGNDVLYPLNKIGELYKQVIAEDNITEKNFTNKSRIYNLKGSYRKIISFANDIQYKTFRYDDYTKALTINDLERLNGKEEPQDQPNGKFRALRISFNLPTSSYATMAYRELLKLTTDILPQVALGENSKQAISNNNNNDSSTINEDNAESNENKKRKIDEVVSKEEKEEEDKNKIKIEKTI